MMAKLFVLYDARARVSLNTDDAMVLDTADDVQEARSLKGDYADDSIWVEYDIDQDGKTLINENLRWDIKT